MRQITLTTLIIAACIVLSTGCKKQEGCTDVTATNYSEDADVNDGTCEYASSTFALTSEAISNGELLDIYKCETKTNDLENSIPLAWSNVPENTGSLAIIMHHFPNSADTVNANSYLLLWDIDPTVMEIAYGTADDGPWYMGSNKDGTFISYTSPCSPSAGTHEYTITVYALSETPSSLPTSSSLTVDYSTMKTAISTVTTIGKAELTFDDVTL